MEENNLENEILKDIDDAAVEIRRRFVSNDEQRDIRHLQIYFRVGSLKGLVRLIMESIDFNKFGDGIPDSFTIESMVYDSIKRLNVDERHPPAPSAIKTYQKLIRVISKVFLHQNEITTADAQIASKTINDLVEGIAYNEGEDPEQLKEFLQLNGFPKILQTHQQQTPQIERSSQPTTVFDSDIFSLIKNGENKQVEFKSTLRWDIKNSNISIDVQHSALKTICAFLNSEGGILLIGVEDNGNIFGLDSDFATFKMDNKNDGFLLYFDDLIQKSFGNQFNSSINIETLKMEEKLVAKVVIRSKYNEPVHMKIDKSNERFYIRRNASTVELKGAELTQYCMAHWSK